MIIKGTKIVLGVPPEILPVLNAPAGPQRFRFRAGEAARVRIRTADGVRDYVLEIAGELWRCAWEVGSNRKASEPLPTINASDSVHKA